MRRSARAAIFILAGLSAGCSRPERREAPAVSVGKDVSERPAAPRVIWIGLDGADPEFLDALAREGSLSAWTRLSREGYRANLESVSPMISPLVWTTEETGVGPEIHGVVDFQEVEPGSRRLVPVSEASRRVPSIWNIASDSGRRVAVVGFWATHPAEVVNGAFVSDRWNPLLGEKAGAGAVSPATISNFVDRKAASAGSISPEELSRFVAMDLEAIRSALAASDEKLSMFARTLQQTRRLNNVAVAFDERWRPDLLAVYFEGTDEVGHLFAPDVPPRLACTSDQEYARFHDTPRRYYAAVEAMLTDWINRAAAEHATLVITSDHGFAWGSDRPCGTSSSATETEAYWHRKNGIFVAWGEGIRPMAGARASVFDVAPTLLALLGLPADALMEGRAIPVRPGLSVVRETGLFARTRRETLPSQPASDEDAGEYARKLAALGYLSPREAAESKAPAAAKLAGRTARGWNNLGVFFQHTRNDPGKAREAFEEALRLNPGYASPMFNLAVIEKAAGHLDKAVERLGRANVSGFPGALVAARSWAAELARESPSAELQLRRMALNWAPAREDVRRELAESLFRRQRCREAADVATALETGREPASLNLAAVVQTCLGRIGRARDLFQRSLALDPAQPAVRDALAALPNGPHG